MLSPFLIHTLGDTRYGVWSVVSALTGYMSLLDLGISSAVAKYVAKHKALNDYKAINVVIGSSLVVLMSVALLLILVSPLLANAMVSFFDFDGELGRTVHALRVMVLACLRWVWSPYAVTSLLRYCYLLLCVNWNRK